MQGHPNRLVSIFYLPIKSGSAHYFSTAIFSILCCILVPEMVVLERSVGHQYALPFPRTRAEFQLGESSFFSDIAEEP